MRVNVERFATLIENKSTYIIKNNNWHLENFGFYALFCHSKLLISSHSRFDDPDLLKGEIIPLENYTHFCSQLALFIVSHGQISALLGEFLAAFLFAFDKMI